VACRLVVLLMLESRLALAIRESSFEIVLTPCSGVRSSCEILFHTLTPGAEEESLKHT